MSSETDSSTVATSESASTSSEYPSESETTETAPESQKQAEKESNAGTGAPVELSGSDAPDHDRTAIQTENSPAPSEQAPQNSNNSSQQPSVPTPKAVHEEEIAVTKKTENETSRRPARNAKGEEKKKQTHAEAVHEAWEKFIKPTIRPFMMADSHRLYSIVHSEIPYEKQTLKMSQMVSTIEDIECWEKVFMKNGNLNLSDKDILNYRSRQEIPVPDIEKLKKEHKIVKFKPTFLGMKKSLKKLCIHCTNGYRPQELILLPPASADKPICARICFQTDGCRHDFYMVGENTCIKAKDDFLFRFGLGLSKQILVSGVRFLNNVFPSGRGVRSMTHGTDREYGRVFFVKCTFDEPLFIQSDVFLIDCKGKELTIYDQLVARCIRCEFDVVHVVGGLLVAKECKIGRMERHVMSDTNDGFSFSGGCDGEKFEVSIGPILGSSNMGSHFVLDRCTVGEDVKVDDQKDLIKYGSAYTNPWTSKDTTSDVQQALEKQLRSAGWHGASCPECHLLRNMKICANCWGGRNRCITCHAPLDARYYGKSLSFCQFCISGSSRLPKELGIDKLADRVALQCALCGALDTCDERGLNYPGMICSKCAPRYDSCHCFVCGKAHGDMIG